MRTSFSMWSASLATVLAVSFQAPSQSDDPLAASRQLARDRYARVENELLARDLTSLTPEQRDARAKLLAVLDAYRTRGDFGINYDQPGARVPLFVDSEGRRCAMAELLHATGRDDLVESVHATNNLAWIVDLAGDASLGEWLARNGLALDEAARIQGPAVVRTPRPDGHLRGGGPVDSKPDTSGPRPSSGPNTPGIGGPSTASSTPTPGPSLPAGMDAFTLSEDSSAWWLWWEYNKIEFLRPNRAQDPAGDAGTSVTSSNAFVRSVMLPVVEHALRDSDSRVRGAAALAYGRLGGAGAVASLLELVQDGNTHVREMAILGLGATGAPKAKDALLALARDERLPGSARELGSSVQPLALVALGIGRTVGFDAALDAQVVELVGKRSLADRETLGVAAMMYATLAPSAELRDLALQLASDGSEPVAVRCRAIEALRTATDAATLSKLQHFASGARLELRRSAALALGEYQHPLVVPALQTASDLEKDQLTRGFLLVGLGRQSGAAARAYLLAELQDGPKPLRPWAALGLGLIAHQHADADLARVLRERVDAEKSSDARAAYWLASGLAGDAEALAPIGDALANDAAPRNRMYAATALALIGGDTAHRALLERVSRERSDLARSAVALGLGVLGRDGDAALIADVFAGTNDPELQSQVSTAMAFHGSSDALQRVNTWLVTDKMAGPTRAAAFDGLGLMIGQVDPLTLGELSRSSDFTLFAPWTLEMLATTL